MQSTDTLFVMGSCTMVPEGTSATESYSWTLSLGSKEQYCKWHTGQA